MKIIQSNNHFKIYADDNLQVQDKLPTGFYSINFDPMSGFSLETRAPLEINEKVYGVHTEKLDKVISSYNLFERSLGVILSGDKGIGKSLFARMLCLKMHELGYPVIIVDAFIPGIADFIDEINQEVLILFDEFDKTFPTTKEGISPQETMLSLFDGISSTKRLYLVTCNKTNKLNEFIVNRPGRFHYHFRFGYPSVQEVEEYMKDKLDEKYWDEIPSVINLSSKTSLNYDCLRAIAFELQTGTTFKDALNDLNIIQLDIPEFDVEVTFESGETVREKQLEIDMFDDDMVKNEFMDTRGVSYYIEFNASKATFNATTGLYDVPLKGAKIYDIYRNSVITVEEAEKLKSQKISKITMRRHLKPISYYV